MTLIIIRYAYVFSGIFISSKSLGSVCKCKKTQSLFIINPKIQLIFLRDKE